MTFRMTAADYAKIRPQLKAIMSPNERRVEFRIQRLLVSPNDYMGQHFGAKTSEYKERKAWQHDLSLALIDALGHQRVSRLLIPNEIVPGCRGERPNVRRSVEVIRYVPSARNFLKDDDNLRFSVKPVLDALKHMGLLFDDRREWAAVGEPKQEISHDKTAWTWIVLDDAAPLPPKPRRTRA